MSSAVEEWYFLRIREEWMRLFLFGLLIAPGLWAHNPIQLENLKPGSRDWGLRNRAPNSEVAAYASPVNVKRGKDVQFFVTSTDGDVTLEIFRMGWYEGLGGRRVWGPSTYPGIVQPEPIITLETRTVECPWKDPILVRAQWLSGIYLAKFTTAKNGYETYAQFVVTEDSRPADIFFQRSITTDQAYNSWGGWSAYGPAKFEERAFKLSFNRPFFNWGAGNFLPNTTDLAGNYLQSGWEYSMLRWLEREGYDVTYGTNLDVHESSELLTRHKAFLSVGHDEYWSRPMRENVARARDSGVNLAFFSANTAYWQVRLEPSAVTGEENHTLVIYKDKTLDPVKDQLATTVWRDPFLNSPEEMLLGVMYDNVPPIADMLVENTAHWIFEKAGLRNGDRIPGILGYEVDRIFERSPEGLRRITHSPFQLEGTRHYSDSTLYQAKSGAWVYAGGTIRYGFGLDDFGVPLSRSSVLSVPLQQMTRNLLARFKHPLKAPKVFGPETPLTRLSFENSDRGFYRDTSGRENHGYSYADSLPLSGVEGKVGKAIQFNGFGQQIALGREASIVGTGPFTVSFWTRTTDKRRQVLISQRDDDDFQGRDWDFSSSLYGYDGQYQIEISEEGKIQFWEYNRAMLYPFQLQSKTVIRDGNWHRIVSKRLKDGTGELWIDEKLEATQNAPLLDLKPHTVFIGADGRDRIHFFSGDIDELVIRNN